MARKGKLTPAAVRAIFKSTESALVMAKRFKVSANLVYLIRARRVHKAITARLKAPLRAERKKPMARMNIDIDRLADAILKRIVDRFRGRR
jgi:hypothetical protein